jgi:hypothetical protein
VGFGLRVDAETLDCVVLDGRQRSLGVGCQQLLSLEPGAYLLSVSAPRNAKPTRFRPVLLGIVRPEAPVPPEYLEDLLQRIGVGPTERR